MAGLFARRWLIAACIVLGWAAGTIIGWVIPPKYRSETVILIEQQTVPEHYVEPNISAANLQQRLHSLSEQILSRTRLLALIDKYGLYGKNAGQNSPDALVERMRDDIKIEMITTEGRRDQLSAFKVSYSAARPEIAKSITTELTSLFINENLQNREHMSEDTTAFLQNQLDEARQSLSEQEQKLKQFRTEHLGELPEQLQSNLQILNGLQNQLQAANDALNQTEQRNLYIRSLLNQYAAPRVFAGHDKSGAVGAPVATLQAQLNALRAQLADLEGRYTERHPDIQRVKQQIAELEAKQARIAATQSSEIEPPSDSGGRSTSVDTGDSLPGAQLTSELSANELQIKNEKEKIRKLELQIELYQSRLNATPARQEQAAAVSRDYDQSRTYYEALLSKKLQSEMATELEKRRQSEQFRMIDAPNLPDRPYFPNRIVCSLAGLGAGLVLGVAIAFFLDRLTPRIHEVGELYEFIGNVYTLGLPAISTQQELAQSQRRRLLEIAAAGLLATLIPAVTIFSYYKH